jgi:hypothetical protein
MTNPVSALRKSLVKDVRWIRFKGIVNNAYLPEFDGYLDEIQRMHKTRSIRVLGAVAAPSGRKIADASMRDQSVRSRCVEICMEVARSRNHLAISMDTVKSYIMAEYSQMLGTHGVRAVTEKREIVNSVFSKPDERLHQLDTITEIADMCIKDIDQSSWAIKSTVTALEIATARERG